jgi:hypothetical protein
MKKIYAVCSFVIGTMGLSAQVVVDNSQTVQSIVEDLFLGNGIFVSNIQFNGQPADVVHDQFGSFTDALSGIGITGGLCMSTGVVADMGADVVTPGWPSNPYSNQDPDVLALLTNELYLGDLASLEFDFIATGNICNFEYVFASDEYPEFVETSFNDHFGFFVSGPEVFGPYSNGGVNIALIPGTTESVSINSLNEFEHPELYVDNTGVTTGVGFDAFTTVLNAHIENLVVGEIYHVKLVIADVTDSALDSGVFLRGDSFQQECAETGAGGAMTETCMLSTLQADVHYTENCGTVSLTNLSEMNIETTNCYYEMGDGNTTAACDANTLYTYDAPGTYTLKLVYEVGAFKAKYTVAQLLISDTAPVVPVIGLDTDALQVQIQNWDGVSGLQWYLNGAAIAGATGISTPIDAAGAYTVVANNGCPASSEPLQVNGIDGLDAMRVLAVYPNPSDNGLRLRLNGTAGRMEVHNMAGQLVWSQWVTPGVEIVLDQPAGVFSVQCMDAQGQVLDQRKAVVQ